MSTDVQLTPHPAGSGLLNDDGTDLVWLVPEDFEPAVPHARRVELLQRIEAAPGPLYLLEPRELLDLAILDLISSEQADEIEEGRWSRAPGTSAVLYDSQKVVELIRIDFKRAPESHCPYDDDFWTSAQEWFDYNTAGAWVGAGTWCLSAIDYDEDVDEDGADVEGVEL